VAGVERAEPAFARRAPARSAGWCVVAEFRIEAGFGGAEVVSGSIRARADHRRTGGDRFRVETAKVVNTRLNEQATRLVVGEGHPDTAARDGPRLTSRSRPVPVARAQLRIVRPTARLDRPIRCITPTRLGS